MKTSTNLTIFTIRRKYCVTIEVYTEKELEAKESNLIASFYNTIFNHKAPKS